MQQRDERVLRVALALELLRRAFGVHDAACLADRRTRQVTERSLEAAKQRGIVGDVAERRDARIRRIEPCAPEGAGLRHDDALDRRDRKISPCAEALEDQAARVRERQRPEYWRRRWRIGERDAQPGAAQCQRERAADRAGAAN